MSALPGEHYCAAHQGNTSHYAAHNCTVCRSQAEIERLRAVLERLTSGYKYSTEVVTIAREALLK